MVQVAGRLIALAPAFALLLAAPRAASEEPEWRLHRSQRGSFQAELPAEPAYSYQEQRTLVGRVPRHHYWIDHPHARIDIERNELPLFATFFVTSRYILDTARDDLMQEIGGRLVRERTITLQGYPGRQIEFVHPDPEPHPEEVRLLLAGQSLYVISAGPFDPDFRESIVERFFDSFRICDDEVDACREPAAAVAE